MRQISQCELYFHSCMYFCLSLCFFCLFLFSLAMCALGESAILKGKYSKVKHCFLEKQQCISFFCAGDSLSTLPNVSLSHSQVRASFDLQQFSLRQHGCATARLLAALSLKLSCLIKYSATLILQIIDKIERRIIINSNLQYQIQMLC